MFDQGFVVPIDGTQVSPDDAMKVVIGSAAVGGMIAYALYSQNYKPLVYIGGGAAGGFATTVGLAHYFKPN